MYSKLLIILVGICLLCFLYIWYKKTNDKFNKLTIKTKKNMNNDEENNTIKLKEAEENNQLIQKNQDEDKSIENFSNLETNLKEDITEDNRYVYFDIYLKDAYKNEKIGKIIIQLFNEEVPKTCNNFYTLLKDKKYNGILFHRVIKGFMIQGGDITNNNGTGGYSVYGDKFEDENFNIKHTTAGLLSMANSGPNTNGSQFFITCAPTPHLDNKHVVFGRVIDGLDVINNIENQLTDNNDKPIQDCYIKDSGTLTKKDVDDLLANKKKNMNNGRILNENPPNNVASPTLSY